MAQVVEHLPGKCKATSPNTGTAKQTKNKTAFKKISFIVEKFRHAQKQNRIGLGV
jgi:hypothetical protein